MSARLGEGNAERDGKMTNCALIEGCIFFNDKMANMPSMANMYKQRYCRGDMELCARYQVFKAVGRENVPADLYPNESERVEAAVSAVEA